ncbi:MAG: hypothetical protein B6244_06175 [Candidatus Cloacimonetes bacterium 4572_55]|nr:MAG: hypothetical protein B6244_06175 [Candidatus Cloacimonetes bacterium 4572_55]
MLVIRKQQMDALSQVVMDTFEDRMVAHLYDTFPEKCAEMGESSVREDIQYGVQRSAQYGIEAERDVCRYIDVMFVLGRDFDNDPSLPKIRAILIDQNIKYARTRMDTIFELIVEDDANESK